MVLCCECVSLRSEQALQDSFSRPAERVPKELMRDRTAVADIEGYTIALAGRTKREVRKYRIGRDIGGPRSAIVARTKCVRERNSKNAAAYMRFVTRTW